MFFAFSPTLKETKLYRIRKDSLEKLNQTVYMNVAHTKLHKWMLAVGISGFVSLPVVAGVTWLTTGSIELGLASLSIPFLLFGPAELVLNALKPRSSATETEKPLTSATETPKIHPSLKQVYAYRAYLNYCLQRTFGIELPESSLNFLLEIMATKTLPSLRATGLPVKDVNGRMLSFTIIETSAGNWDIKLAKNSKQLQSKQVEKTKNDQPVLSEKNLYPKSIYNALNKFKDVQCKLAECELSTEDEHSFRRAEQDIERVLNLYLNRKSLARDTKESKVEETIIDVIKTVTVELENLLDTQINELDKQLLVEQEYITSRNVRIKLG